jgi:hypothetical protein
MWELGFWDQEFDISETNRAQELALAEVWSDPLLDEYTADDGEPIRTPNPKSKSPNPP